jgi:GTPase SAR1 family protein
MKSAKGSTSSSKGEIGEFQIAVLGTSGVGKSSLVRRYTKDTFSEEYTPNMLDNVSFRFRFGNRFGVLSTLP